MIIYKTTNLITNEWYIGKDAKNRKNYLGSGKILKNAINVYGKQNFKKEILYHAISLIDLAEKEIEYIKIEREINKNRCYNIAIGGEGGDTFTNNPNKESIRKKHKESGLKNKMTTQCRDASNEWKKKYHKAYGSEVPDDVKEQYRLEHSEKLKEYWSCHDHPWKGKKHTDATKIKMSEKLKGENHPNWGKHHSNITRDKLSQSLLNAKNPFKIKIIDMDLNETIVDTMRDAELFVCGSRGYIKKCIMGKRDSYKGYRFEYVAKG